MDVAIYLEAVWHVAIYLEAVWDVAIYLEAVWDVECRIHPTVGLKSIVADSTRRLNNKHTGNTFNYSLRL